MQSLKIEEDYFQIKDRVSNSMLSWMEEGPGYFLGKLMGDIEQRESLAMENGTLLHLYIEDPSKFIISDVEKPAGMMGTYLEEFVSSGENHDAAYKKAGFLISPTAVQKKFLETKNQDYLAYLMDSQGKLALTKDQKTKIEGGINALTSDERCKKYLGLVEEPHLEILNETVILFDQCIYGPSGEKILIPCKAKVDKIIIDHKEKRVIISDLKTTSINPRGILYRKRPEDLSTGYAYLDYGGTNWLGKYLIYRYYRQKEFYREAVEWYLTKELGLDLSTYKLDFTFIVIKLGPGFEVALYTDNFETRKRMDYPERELTELMLLYHKYILMGELYQPSEQLLIL